MALAKEQNPNCHPSHMSGLDHQSNKLYGKQIEETKSQEKKGNFARISSNSSSLSSLGSATSSGGFDYGENQTHQNYEQQLQPEGDSVITFKPGYYDHNFMHSATGSCFLSFAENEEQLYSSSLINPHQLMNLGSGSFDSMRFPENMNCIQSGNIKENQHQDELESFAWLNPSTSDKCLATQKSTFHKRTHSGESEQAFKKQCITNTATKKSEHKLVQPKDPQSMAAKNRRERISERLKVLQDLVPNGSKVDLVTMLEKAISYVKFLQLQVKVLAADEFWPVQGGKPPELSQVKDAIDAILSSSQRDRCSSSK